MKLYFNRGNIQSSASLPAMLRSVAGGTRIALPDSFFTHGQPV